jgi:hypothetical protein
VIHVPSFTIHFSSSISAAAAFIRWIAARVCRVTGVG